MGLSRRKFTKEFKEAGGATGGNGDPRRPSGTGL